MRLIVPLASSTINIIERFHDTMSRRLSDLESLRQLLHEAEQRAEEARASREEADAYRAEAERRAQDERASREAAEQRLRNTTLVEYLQLCHQNLFLSMSVQPDKSLTATSPVGKIHPKRLRPWKDFLDQQKSTFERLYTAYPPEDRQLVFENENALENQGRRIMLRPVGFESDLMHVQREAVETPATLIINHLSSVDAVSREFKLGGRIAFDNQPHALSDESKEVIQSRGQQSLEPSTPGVLDGRSRPRTDQVCVYTEANGVATRRRLAFIIEDKAPHKLPIAMLRKGLHRMNVREDVIDQPGIPTDEDDLLQYHADRLVAAAVTQIFSYMIEGGVRYGYITTGEAFVFLHIRSNDPTTVRYHLVQPRADVEAQASVHPDDYAHRTALGQVLAFSLLALESKSKPNNWQQSVIDKLTPWKEDFDAILRKIPASIRKTPSTQPYRPRPFRLDRQSPVKTRSKTAAACRPQEDAPVGTSGSESDSDFERPDTPTRARGAACASQPTASSAVSSPDPAASESETDRRRQFCTHDCLLGLAVEGLQDPKCPNVAEHGGENGHHGLNLKDFFQRLYQQLERTMDTDCSPMGMDGARGALFMVSLASHGYTLVAKGTVRAFVSDLEHEADIYEHLEALQGVSVPVCLGSINLPRPYYYDIGVRIIHMMFLSWAGRRIDKVEDCVKPMDHPRWKCKISRAIKRLGRAGIRHNDVRPPNILWDDRLRRIMVIDFERSDIIENSPLPTPLSPSSGNKRKRDPAQADGLEIHVKPA